MTALELTGLKVVYGQIIAVHDLSFHLEHGESVALLGPNGAGKTSTVEAISGLLPKAAGCVRLGNADITDLAADAVAKNGLALVPQWRDLFPTFSVQETLLAGSAAAVGRQAKPVDYIYDLFPRLHERRQQEAGSLSGGEQQMLAIGRALIGSPKVLLLDEPSAGLAVGITNVLLDVLSRIRNDGVSILLVEQKLDVASAVADRCIVLSVGTEVWEGSMADASQLEEIKKAYFA